MYIHPFVHKYIYTYVHVYITYMYTCCILAYRYICSYETHYLSIDSAVDLPTTPFSD